MPEINSSGLSSADVQALINAQPSGFVNGGGEMTVAQLLANYPADASMVFKYARVSDLHGGAFGHDLRILWRAVLLAPAAHGLSGASTATGGAVALTPLLTPPTLIFTGTLTGNVTATPSTANVWPGASFTVIANGLLGLFGINLGGLVGGGTIPLLSGSSRTMTYVPGSGWRAG